HYPFDLFLFATHPEVIQAATDAGMDGFVVDWETKGKEQRQRGFDTQINRQTLDDLRTVRKNTAARLICRINSLHDDSREEVERALDGGADEILLPMVRQPQQVDRVLTFIAGRKDMSILIETQDGVECAAELNNFPLKHIYVGLNDMAIDRGLKNIFISVTDGTIERIRKNVTRPFGFAGLTLPDRGFPIPCRLLFNEMALLNCSFTFLRRSFLRDVPISEFDSAIQTIRLAMDSAHTRTAQEKETLHQELIRTVEAWNGKTLPVADSV
ncbi:MAG TPA: aldolase/citrate lyase family protein, partial [Longilinea sp.]|nr:aldolase/citrate lyase family protein [Longilinea sp.]